MLKLSKAADKNYDKKNSPTKPSRIKTFSFMFEAIVLIF